MTQAIADLTTLRDAIDEAICKLMEGRRNVDLTIRHLRALEPKPVPEGVLIPFPGHRTVAQVAADERGGAA